MVPHGGDDTIRPLLERIASAASEKIGVILLSPEPGATQKFIETQSMPQRFSVVGAHYDTPWLRDRAPIAIREAGEIRWALPRLPQPDRQRDDKLFEMISARPASLAPLLVAQGNLVAGPRGIAISTDRLLRENDLSQAGALDPIAPELGIAHWIVIEPFPDEPTGHADVHVRFLRPDLMAVAWHASDAEVQKRARAIESAVRAVMPRIRILRIPLQRSGNRYASLVNWIQIGRHLLMPVYELTTEACFADARALLTAEGFHVHPIDSPTLALGGSLHCLTASIFV